jgi:uncharacterized protein (DUF983 family)
MTVDTIMCPFCGELNLYGDGFDNLEPPDECIKCGYDFTGESQCWKEER